MIEVRNVTKTYKIPVLKEGRFYTLRNFFSRTFEEKKAVDNISFQISDGETVGYIGPNGSGKSTTIKMLSGILTPTSGEILVNGLEPGRNRSENARNIGVIFGQKTSLWWDVPVIDSYRLLKEMYCIDDAVYRKNLDKYADMLDLGSFLEQPVRQLSLGQRVRADLAAALIHDPKVLFLDEPTIGVDVLSKEKLREFIKELNREQKVTILLTTHDMVDLEKLVRRVIVIDSGKIFYDGDMDSLRDLYGQRRKIELTFSVEDPQIDIPGLSLLEASPYRRSYSFLQNEISAEQVIAQFAAISSQITDVSVQKADIEEVVRNIYFHSGRKDA